MTNFIILKYSKLKTVTYLSWTFSVNDLNEKNINTVNNSNSNDRLKSR